MLLRSKIGVTFLMIFDFGVWGTFQDESEGTPKSFLNNVLLRHCQGATFGVPYWIPPVNPPSLLAQAEHNSSTGVESSGCQGKHGCHCRFRLGCSDHGVSHVCWYRHGRPDDYHGSGGSVHLYYHMFLFDVGCRCPAFSQ